jgi:hypothetical protein
VAVGQFLFQGFVDFGLGTLRELVGRPFFDADAQDARLLADQDVDAVDGTAMRALLGPGERILPTLLVVHRFDLVQVGSRHGGVGLDQEVAAVLAINLGDALVGLFDGLGTEELAVVADLRRHGQSVGRQQPTSGGDGQHKGPAMRKCHGSFSERGYCM